MNKFEKVALQAAKDDLQKGYDFKKLRRSKRMYYAMFKSNKWPFKKVIGFKNYNKSIKW